MLNKEENFRKALRIIRRSRNLTQDEFVEGTEINYKSYGKIERGEVSPKITTIFKIITAQNISLSEIEKVMLSLEK